MLATGWSALPRSSLLGHRLLALEQRLPAQVMHGCGGLLNVAAVAKIPGFESKVSSGRTQEAL